MNAAVLIDAIVRQTTVLIAALATAAGQRAQLAHVADQVFADLARELNDQGVGHKVIADMFGLALRTYHRKTSRLAASTTLPGRSLWEAVLGFIQEKGSVQRGDVLSRFARDNDAVLRGILRDLVESGLVYQTGRADGTSYRAALEEEAVKGDATALDSLLLVAIHRHGPVERARLSELVSGNDEAALAAALERLVREETVREVRSGGGVRYECDTCVIPFGDAIGWEGAVFDHYQALVTALVTKLRLGKRRADLSDKIGGSTFVLDLWRDHPLSEEVLGHLKTMRESGMTLRRKLDAFNAANPRPAGASPLRVIAYVGQTVQEEDAGDDAEDANDAG